MKQQDWKQMGHTILNNISFLLTWTFICFKDKTQNQTLNQLHSNPTTPVSITGKMVGDDRWAERFFDKTRNCPRLITTLQTLRSYLTENYSKPTKSSVQTKHTHAHTFQQRLHFLFFPPLSLSRYSLVIHFVVKELSDHLFKASS